MNFLSEYVKSNFIVLLIDKRQIHNNFFGLARIENSDNQMSMKLKIINFKVN